MVADGFSGARLMARNGSVVAATCTGFADRDGGRRWTRGTRGQVASISKQFAAIVALNLVDQGVLALADPVTSVLTEASAQWQTVTLQHLLTHTSGLGHWSERPGFDPAQSLEPAERLALLLAAPLTSSPGVQWRYSSPGYIVLSAVLETVAGAGYAQLVEDQIIGPPRPDRHHGRSGLGAGGGRRLPVRRAGRTVGSAHHARHRRHLVHRRRHRPLHRRHTRRHAVARAYPADPARHHGGPRSTRTAGSGAGRRVRSRPLLRHRERRVRLPPSGRQPRLPGVGRVGAGHADRGCRAEQRGDRRRRPGRGRPARRPGR